jgi:hypothetical protein
VVQSFGSFGRIISDRSGVNPNSCQILGVRVGAVEVPVLRGYRSASLGDWCQAFRASNLSLLQGANVGRFHPFYRPRRPLGRVEL